MPDKYSQTSDETSSKINVKDEISSFSHQQRQKFFIDRMQNYPKNLILKVIIIHIFPEASEIAA